MKNPIESISCETLPKISSIDDSIPPRHAAVLVLPAFHRL